MLVPADAVLERTGSSTRSSSPTARTPTGRCASARAGTACWVVPASRVHHRVSAASGGESSPTTLYYGLRNALVVAERHAPLGRPGTLRRRAVATAAILAQALLSRQRRAGVRAVAEAIRDLRAGQVGRRGESIL